MRKILGLTLAAMLVLALAGIGTWAFFSDVESSSGNILTAGSLDLTIDGGNSDVQLLTSSIGNIVPGDSGNASCVLANVGTIAAELDIAILNLTNDTVTTVDCEDDDGTDDGGDLGEEVDMVLWIDADESGDFSDGDIELNHTGANAYNASTNTTLDMVAIDNYDGVSWDAAFASLDENGGTNPAVTFKLDWDLPDATDNSIMTDTVTFDIEFTLEQQ
jgi:spore coat-associated protein N